MCADRLHVGTELLRAQLADARRERAEWLYSLANRIVTPVEALQAAKADELSALRNMSLRSLIEARYSTKRCASIFSQLGRTLNCDLKGTYVPVRWLFSRRSHYERFDCLIVLLQRAPECNGPFGLPEPGQSTSATVVEPAVPELVIRRRPHAE